MKAELSCLFAEAHFGSLLCLFIATVEDGFRVRLFGQRDVIENPCDFMGGGGDGLGSAQLGSHASKELAEVTFPAGEGVGAIRSAVAARCFTLRVLQDSILLPLTRFSQELAALLY